MNTTIDTATASAFTGDFDLLPVRAAFDYAPVPAHPTAEDFHLAVSALRTAEDRAEREACGTVTWNVAAARWRVEAIRERRMQPAAPINTREVFARTGEALAQWAREV